MCLFFDSLKASAFAGMWSVCGFEGLQGKHFDMKAEHTAWDMALHPLLTAGRLQQADPTPPSSSDLLTHEDPELSGLHRRMTSLRARGSETML